MKVDVKHADDIWLAKSGFGGTEYLLPALVSEGTKRGMSLNHVAEVTSFNPAKRYGLNRKGDSASCSEVDRVLGDPKDSWTVRSDLSESDQGYTPFEGVELSAKVKQCFLRGTQIYDGQIVGKPNGQYLTRPY